MNEPIPNRRPLPWRRMAFWGLFYVVLTALVQNAGFFWDTVLLSSRYATYYYQHPGALFVPEAIAGYPPLMGKYLSGAWQLLGRNLPASHWAMLPWLLLIAWNTILLVRRFISPRWAPTITALLLLEPALLAQSTQPAPDVILVACYLAALNAILAQRRLLTGLWCLPLVLLSPRAELSVAALALTDLLIRLRAPILLLKKPREGALLPDLWHWLKPYLPAAALLAWWLWRHYQHFGWIGYNPESQWASLARPVDGGGLAHNLATIAFRLVDQGRIFLWLTWAALIWKRQYFLRTSQDRLLNLLWITPLAVYSLAFLPWQNPVGHRYYLVVYLLLGLMVAYYLHQTPLTWLRKTALWCLFAGYITGHLWLYPNPIAKGWDSTLAYLFLDEPRHQTLLWANRNGIGINQISSDFPLLDTLDHVWLNGDPHAPAAREDRPNTYYLYANVINGSTAPEQDTLEPRKLLHEEGFWPVTVQLYAPPTSPETPDAMNRGANPPQP